jgi:hypothetical protein
MNDTVMKRKTFIHAMIAFGLLWVACSRPQSAVSTSTIENKENVPMVGGDKDAKGCIGSAGYQWSVAKNRCIRIWEDGTRFEKYPAEKTVARSKAAFVVLSDDKSTAEVIFEGLDTSVLLSKVAPVSGDKEPVYYENEASRLKIQLQKNAFWILRENKTEYFSEYSEKDGFNTKL